jgi:hypothetical protein
MDLSELTIEIATPLTGTTFEVALADGTTTTLRLDEAAGYERRGRPLRGARAPRREPFALYFLGSPDVVLPQGAYTLRAGAATFEGIFLVPVGRDDEATEYEAIFS